MKIITKKLFKMKKKILSFFLFSSLIGFAQTGTEIDGSFNSVSGDNPPVSVNRSYRLYVPLSYNPASASVPLVMNFHGLGGSSSQQETYGDFRKIADTANFIKFYRSIPRCSASELKVRSFLFF